MPSIHVVSPQMRAVQTYALQRALSKYGIIELARTGKICLKRGEELLDMGGWGDAQAAPGSTRSSEGSAEASVEPTPARQQAQKASTPPRAGGNDVYVDSDDGEAGASGHRLAGTCLA